MLCTLFTFAQHAYRLGVIYCLEKRSRSLTIVGTTLGAAVGALLGPRCMSGVTADNFYRAYYGGCTMPLEQSPTTKDLRAHTLEVPRHKHPVRTAVRAAVVTASGFQIVKTMSLHFGSSIYMLLSLI